MQFAGVEDERTEPGRAKGVGVADDGVEIVVMSGQSGRGQGRLLHQGVVRKVAVFGGAQEPLRLRSLGPVKTQRADVIAEGDGNVLRDKDRRNAWMQADRSNVPQCIELPRARRAVRNT